MKDENMIHIDSRALIPPRLRATDPPPNEPEMHLLETDEDDGGGLQVFPTLLLALGVVFALIGAARLAWNVYEGAFLDPNCFYCGFYGFFILDRSMPYFAAFALFVLAAGVWHRR